MSDEASTALGDGGFGAVREVGPAVEGPLAVGDTAPAVPADVATGVSEPRAAAVAGPASAVGRGAVGGWATGVVGAGSVAAGGRVADVIGVGSAVVAEGSLADVSPAVAGRAIPASVSEVPGSVRAVEVGPVTVGRTSATGVAVRGTVEAGAWSAPETDVRGAPEADGDAEVGLVGPAGVPDWRERAGTAVRERMPLWLQTRCGLERRNVVALTVLFAVAALFAVQHFWSGRTQTVQAPEVMRAVAPHEEQGRHRAAPAGAPVTARGPATSPGTEIVVDVSGKVRRPGIQHLPTGSRVADALQAAGGVRPGTNTDALNRARFLVDGEHVVVGGPAPAAAPDAPGQGLAGASGTDMAGTSTAPVALNTASAEQLQTLPGVGPVLARRIIDYRTQHGGFRSVDQLREVSGIGTRRFADLRALVSP